RFSATAAWASETLCSARCTWQASSTGTSSTPFMGGAWARIAVLARWCRWGPCTMARCSRSKSWRKRLSQALPELLARDLAIGPQGHAVQLPPVDRLPGSRQPRGKVNGQVVRLHGGCPGESTAHHGAVRCIVHAEHHG